MSARHVEVPHLVGSKVLDILPGYSGTVLAVVSAAAYLLGDNDEVLWIAGEATPMHQRCIHVSLDLARLQTGIEFWTEGCQMLIGNAVTLDLVDAPRWQPPAVGSGAPKEGVAACYRAVLAAVQSMRQAKGLAKALPLISAADSGSGLPAREAPDPLIERASGSINAIAMACRRRAMDGIAAHSRALIGLGPGLTPSGDDFVGGLLFTVRCLHAAYPGDFPQDGQAIDALIDWARRRTNRISVALIRDMADGEGPEPLHRVLMTLLNDSEPHRVLTAINRLTRIGHSSGWDMLAGVLTGMLLIAS